MSETTSPAPSWGRGLTRSRGASGWRLKIYDALYEADLEGRTLTLHELVDECVERFNRSGRVVVARCRETTNADHGAVD